MVTTMTRDEFDALVARLENDAHTQPGAYTARVLGLAALGNAYVMGILLLIVALLVGLVASVAVLKALAIKLIFIVGIFLWMVIKALWVKIPPPTGTEVTAQDSPELFAMIEALRRDLDAPRFHHVLVTDDFNAGVVQSPRLGVFGWPRNYLLIGLPLMKSLSVEQFKAVLAHEFGHLARGHGRVSNWIYRQRLRWARLVDVLEATESRGGFLFKPFLNRFVPYFTAYSFPMARANEYQADATAVRLTSPDAAAEALTGVEVMSSYLSERFWPQLHRQADDQAQPNVLPYTGMGRHFVEDVDADSTRSWLEQAMARQTGSGDTHPALKDRLAAFDAQPRLAPPTDGTSADRLLGDALETITEAFDHQWREAIAPSWDERYREVKEGRARLAALNERAQTEAPLPRDEALERAQLTESIADDADGALAQLRALLERVPDDPVVLYSVGTRLLDRDDDGGQPLIERAMTVDEAAIAPGSEALRDYHWRHGRKEEADAWHERLVERSELEYLANKERNEVRLDDTFECHELPDAPLARLREQLSGIGGVRKAYLLRKRVRHQPDRPLYVLGFSITGALRRHNKDRAEAIQRHILDTVELPDETIVICVDGDNKQFGSKFFWKRGARVM